MNALQKAVSNFLDAIDPIRAAAEDPVVRETLLAVMGAQPGSTNVPTLPPNAVQRIEAFLDLDEPELLDSIDIAELLLEIAVAVHDLAKLELPGSADEALKRIVSMLTLRWLRLYQPVAYCVARMLRVIETTSTNGWSEELHPERIGDLVTDAHKYFAARYPLNDETDAKPTSDAVFLPLAALAAYIEERSMAKSAWPIQPMYGWDSPPTPGAPIGEAVARRTLGVALSHYDTTNDVDLSALLALAFITKQHGGPGLALSFEGAAIQMPLGKDWSLGADFGAENQLALWWVFGQEPELLGTSSPTVTVDVKRKPNPSRKPLTLPLGKKSRFEIGDVDFHLDVNAREIDAKVTIHDAALIVGRDSSDSFSGSRMPSGGVRGDFDLIIGISSVRGVYLGGTAGISATIPLNRDVGPLHLDTLTIEVRPDPARDSIRIAAGLTLSLEVGPVIAVVDGMGVRLDVSFPETGANLGAVDIQPAFQWPRGIGVTIEAGVVTGGGYIYFDPDKGRYAGVLQLEMKSFSIKAIGLLDTKLPGGEKGFSFLIIISAEFSPISLAMGFTLNGVGGLAGLHRTIAVDPLQAGVRNHAVDDILFPEDPVKNAPRIISDLQRFFPPMKNRYVFGPMALIGWGSPTLLTIELGIIIELPKPVRIVLLGQLNCALPTPASAIIELHVDILGILDFGAKLFSLDGVIHDSRIGPFALYGDFAVRLRWGERPSFALSIGGFHPRFPLPAQFPSLRRITLALSDGDNPRLTMQCYFAVTSNSLQFGSRADLYAAAGKFNVSGWIGFDVLLIFRPFSLRADLTAGFALRRNSRYLAGIHIEATLTGPGPWHVWGEASLTILCWDVSVSFDLTIGSAPAQALPSTDIWASLRPAMQLADNWSAVMPPGTARVVTLAKPEGTTEPVLDPVGMITLTQRTAPFDRVNTKFAEAVPGGTRRFDLQSVMIRIPLFDNQPFFVTIADWNRVHELFPPAQVEQMSDDQKLSRPSFEKMVAGLSFPDLVSIGTPVGTDLQYRTVVIDSTTESHNGAMYDLSPGVLEAAARAGAAASGGMRRGGSDKYVTTGQRRVTLADESFVIASADDLKKRADLAKPGPKGEVLASLADHITAHPEDRGRLIVVPLEEAA